MQYRPIAYNGNGAYIFVSYAHKDHEIVYELVDIMVKTGYNVWYDEGIERGTSTSDEIAMKIEDCSAFISFMSRNYSISSYSLKELHYAIEELKKLVIPVYLEKLSIVNNSLPSGLRMLLSDTNAITNISHPKKYIEEIKLIKKLDICHNDDTNYELRENPYSAPKAKYDSTVYTTTLNHTKSEPIINKKRKESIRFDTKKELTDLNKIINIYITKQKTKTELLLDDFDLNTEGTKYYIAKRLYEKVSIIESFQGYRGGSIHDYWGVQIYIYDYNDFRRIYLFAEGEPMSFWGKGALNIKISKKKLNEIYEMLR